MSKKPAMDELRVKAEERGIKVPFGVTKDALIEMLDASPPEPAQADPAPAQAAPAEPEPHPDDVRANPRAARETSRDGVGRAERVPLGTPQAKLDFSEYQRPGYQLRVINDKGDRMRRAEVAGWQFVEDKRERDEAGRGKRVTLTVGTKEDGAPLWAYLMEIRDEFYKEDQQAKQSAIDESEAAITSGNPAGESGETEKFYTPTEGASVRNDARS